MLKSHLPLASLMPESPMSRELSYFFPEIWLKYQLNWENKFNLQSHDHSHPLVRDGFSWREQGKYEDAQDLIGEGKNLA